MYATVEVKGQYTWGQMVVDWNSVLKKQANVKIVTDINQSTYELILQKLVHDERSQSSWNSKMQNLYKFVPIMKIKAIVDISCAI